MSRFVGRAGPVFVTLREWIGFRVGRLRTGATRQAGRWEPAYLLPTADERCRYRFVNPKRRGNRWPIPKHNLRALLAWQILRHEVSLSKTEQRAIEDRCRFPSRIVRLWVSERTLVPNDNARLGETRFGD
jgi:hypothetical protein